MGTNAKDFEISSGYSIFLWVEMGKNCNFAAPIKSSFLLNGFGSPVHTGRYHQKNNLQWLKKFQALLSCR